MYNSIESFLSDFEHEFDSTNKYFSAITDDILEKKFHQNIRTIGWLSWHIVSSIPEMLNHAGFQICINHNLDSQPSSVDELITTYHTFYQEAVLQIKKTWKDDMLNEDVSMYGQVWKKGLVLSSLLFHQCHHRGQLSILMRLADCKVPGIIGPSKEEWMTYGLEPHK